MTRRPTETEELLRERARQLAQPLRRAEEAASTRQALRFRWSGDRYVVPLTDVRQVVPLVGAARLPTVVWPLVALVAVAGDIAPVVSPGRRGSGTDVASTTPWAVAVDAGDTVLCLPADAVDGLVTLPDGERHAPADGAGDGRPHVRGLTPAGDALLAVDQLPAWAGTADDGRDGPRSRART